MLHLLDINLYISFFNPFQVHEVFEDIINQVVSFISEQNWMEENVKERVSNEVISSLLFVKEKK